jgi:hypothetical protein
MPTSRIADKIIRNEELAVNNDTNMETSGLKRAAQDSTRAKARRIPKFPDL